MALFEAVSSARNVMQKASDLTQNCIELFFVMPNLQANSAFLIFYVKLRTRV